jgi:hypothetical protein
MKRNWRRIATTLGLASCLAMLAPACIIRARARMQPAVYVVDTEPPPPKYVTVTPRAGHVWVRGHYEWRNRWQWVPGHWERQRSGMHWMPGQWERRGNRWHWQEGRWAGGAVPHKVVPGAPAPRAVPGAPAPRAVPGAPAPRAVPSAPNVRDHRDRAPAPPRANFPTAPPPAPQAERPGAARAGHVWIAGHYKWQAGRYAWVPGHWERARAGKRWMRGSWKKQGGQYVWVEGSWGAETGRGKVRDHRKR